VPLFLIAGCRTLQQTAAGVAGARNLARHDARWRIAAKTPWPHRKGFSQTTAGALRESYMRESNLTPKNFAGAAALLDSSAIRDYTVIRITRYRCELKHSTRRTVE